MSLPPVQTWLLSTDQEDPQEERMASHASILAWRIPWAEDRSLAGCSPWGLQRAGHD